METEVPPARSNIHAFAPGSSLAEARILAPKSDAWYRRYSERVLELKSLHKSRLNTVKRALRSGLEKIYRGVAFDVDGTLIESDQQNVAKDLAQIIGSLLRQGVPVVLISGRGRGKVREAAKSIQAQCKLPLWYFRRLQCITHNGTHLLFTSTSSPERFLEQEEVLAPMEFDKNTFRLRLLAICADYRRYEPFLSIEPESFRIILRPSAAIKKIQARLLELKLEYATRREWFCISTSEFGDDFVFDITPISKVAALRKVALRMGLHIDDFIRIGDRGADGGNDFELLNAISGFSVRYFSRQPKGCFPILDARLCQPLNGTVATQEILRLVRILPPLSLAARRINKRLADLREFERLAQRRAHEISAEYAALVSRRYRTLESTGQKLKRENRWNSSEAFDPHSGAVRIRDWDLADMQDRLPRVWRLFGIPGLHKKVPRSDWCMYTDTGIILRGPVYYYSLSLPRNRRIIDFLSYSETYSRFFVRAKDSLPDLRTGLMTPLVFKCVLGIYDNLRNFSSQCFYVAYTLSQSADVDDVYSVNSYRCMERVIAGYADALLNPDIVWRDVCDHLEQHLRDALVVAKELVTTIKKGSLPHRVLNQEVFKYRETDFFLQNYAAVEIAVRDIARHGLVQKPPLCAVGLAFGGLDLPAICQYVCSRSNIPCVPAVLKLSMYSGTDQHREKIYRGDHSYIQHTANAVRASVFLANGAIETSLEDRTCVILDDNCTTCATLQLARDVLLFKGAQAIGAIIVRYPGMNRFNHMAIRHHGFPEPENLFSFVRGLVAPAPYSRLVIHDVASKYEDQIGIFDKSKARIKILLEKRKPFPSPKSRFPWSG